MSNENRIISVAVGLGLKETLETLIVEIYDFF